MGRPYDAYWGKADPSVGGFHRAAFHSLDVAAVALRQIERGDVLRSRLAALLVLQEDRVAPTVAAWAALHDIGKLDVRFQLKRYDVATALDSRRASCRFKGSYDHGAWGYHQLRRELSEKVRTTLGEGVGPILQAVTGHHGELPSKGYRPADEDAEPFAADDQAARAAFLYDVAELFRASCALLPYAGAPPAFPAVALIAGLCSVADWIGSQVDHFPYGG
jgi:CRISPR-associated endonuclease/helicase Cas3